jgi:hypothetical protein
VDRPYGRHPGPSRSRFQPPTLFAVTHDRRRLRDTDHHAADADVHNVCEAVGVTFDFTGLAEQIRMRAADWQALSLSWTEREISPNYGKATTSAGFECEEWTGEISIWDTGETDLLTARTSEDSGVNKHYDLEDAAQLDVVLSELIGLIPDGTARRTQSHTCHHDFDRSSAMRPGASLSGKPPDVPQRVNAGARAGAW